MLIGRDNSLIFFNEKGTILKFDQESKLIWKKNIYSKKERKLNPLIFFGTNNKILIAADDIANIYALDYFTGELLWKNINSSSFNSEIKIFKDKLFLIDFENNLRCISIKDGNELWSFRTEKSFIDTV